MASAPSAPDPSALESLDDLISRKFPQAGAANEDEQQQKQGGARGGSLAVPVEETPSSSSVTITAQSPQRQTRPRDETRWNGFHLWRTESYNLRAASERAAAEARRLADRQGWVREWSTSIRRWFGSAHDVLTGRRAGENAEGEVHMSRFKMLLLTLIMAGAQLAWCLEFGYGTPYLLSLGLSKASTSLVWLAAPLSGLIMQPLIGVLSDLSTSAFRRRKYILAALLVLVLSTLVLAFSKPIASALVDLLHTGLADWDPARKEALDQIARFIAVLSFVLLDLSINSLQAAARALILDTAPSSQHSRANAWHGRMTHVGNVAGYAAGWYDLSSTPVLSWLGGDQFRKYAVVSVVGVAVCSIITCAAIREERREPSEGLPAVGVVPKMREATHHIYQSIRRLPRPVRRICLVQLFAFMGWFPLLFYSSQWIIETREKEKGEMGGSTTVDDEAAERGSFALLMFALVALLSGTVLPYLSLSNSSNTQAVHLAGPEDQLVSGPGQSNGADQGKPRRRPWKLTLRTIWTISLVLYSAQASVLTFTVQSSRDAIILLASIGIPWAVASWVPFALVMESVREAEDGTSPFEFEADWFAPERVRGRRESSSAFAARATVARSIQDCEPLPHASDPPRSSFLARGAEVVGDNARNPSRQTSLASGVPLPVSNQDASHGGSESLGGTVLGIHNLAIVLPQLLVALLAALILRTGPASQSSTGSGGGGVSVVWVIRIGGLASFVAAMLTRLVPLTRTERHLRGQGNLDPEPRFDDEATEADEEERGMRV